MSRLGETLHRYFLAPARTVTDPEHRRNATLYASAIAVITVIGAILGMVVFPWAQGASDFTENATWRATLAAFFGCLTAYRFARLGRLALAGQIVVASVVAGAWLAAFGDPRVMLFMNAGAVMASVLLSTRSSIVFAVLIALGPVVLWVAVPSLDYRELVYIQGTNVLLPALLLLVGWYRGQLVKERDQREARFSELVRTSPDGILYVGADLNIIMCNPAIEELSGYPAHDLLEGPLATLGLQAILPVVDSTVPKPQLHNVQLLCNDGSTRTVECLVQPVDDPLIGRGTQIMVRDVQERERARAVRDQLEAQLQDARRLESIGRLAGGVAHDINNQLTVIIVSTDLLLHGAGDDECIRSILTAAEHSSRLIAQLLTFARGHTQEVSDVDINVILDDFKTVLRTVVRADVTMELVLTDESTTVHADSVQFQQTIINLVANASDAMPEGGHLRVRTEVEELSANDPNGAGLPAGRYVAIEVKDEGVGIDAEGLSRMFEPFFTTKEVGSGTGLGLATVHGSVTRAGGAVYATSTPGVGTTFRVLLPWIEPMEAVAIAPTAESQPDWSCLDVLIVDDQRAVGEVAERVLQGVGCRTKYFQISLSALKHIESSDTNYNLVISDVIMPGCSGPKLVEQYRQNRENISVLFMSGYPFREDLQDEKLLSKPFTPKQLLGAVAQLMTT